MRIFEKRYYIFLALCLLLIVLGYYVNSHWNEFERIKSVSWEYTVVLCLLTFIYLLIQGYILKIVVAPFNIRLTFIEWFGVKVVQLMGNYVFPFGGLGFRAVYLKEKHGLAYSDSLSTFSVVIVIELLVFTFCGLLSIAYLYAEHGIYEPTLAGALLLVFISICTVVFWKPISLNMKNGLSGRINSIMESWYKMRNNRNLLKQIIILTLIEFLSFALIFHYAFKALNLNIPFIGTFIVTCLSDYSFFIRIAPASFGTYEASIIYSTKVFGFTIADGLLVAGIVRIISMFWLFSLGPIFSYLLMGRQNTSKFVGS